MKTSAGTAPALLALVAQLVTPAAIAVALRPEKATDPSVCDLGPNTNPVLARKMLIPADSPSSDQVEAYFRLAATFVVDNCSRGQLLIVHGDASQQVDLASLSRLANEACIASSILRSEVPFTYAGRSRPGFELRCPIEKTPDLARRLADAERADPTETLRSRLAGSRPVEQDASGTAAKRDCSKVTLATVLQGGSSDCR